MGRYLIKFKKEGRLRFISHLDLARLFNRTIRRAGISLRYSQGYNPHPKMSLAQPLSLGFCSVSEYLEIETLEDIRPTDIIERMNPLLPPGVSLVDCKEIEAGSASFASKVAWGTYIITWKGITKPFDISKEIEEFMSQDRILIQKLQRKRNIIKETDIKPMIGNIKLKGEKDGSLIISTALRTGGSGNLNPEILMESFSKYANVPYLKENLCICRTGLYEHWKEDDETKDIF